MRRKRKQKQSFRLSVLYIAKYITDNPDTWLMDIHENTGISKSVIQRAIELLKPILEFENYNRPGFPKMRVPYKFKPMSDADRIKRIQHLLRYEKDLKGLM